MTLPKLLASKRTDQTTAKHGGNKQLMAVQGLWRLLAQTSWRHFILVFVLTALVGASEGLNLLVLVTLLEVIGVTAPSSPGALTAFTQTFFQRFDLPPTLATSLALFVLLAALRALLVRLETHTSFSLVNTIVALLRKRLYAAITNSSWLYFSRTATSHFTFSLTEETDRLGNALNAFLSLMVTTAMALFYLSLSFILSLPLTLTVLGSGLLLLLLLHPKTKLASQRGEAVSQAYDHLYRATSDHLAGVKTSKSHGFERTHIRAFSAIAERVREVHHAVVTNRATVKFWFDIGAASTLALSLYVSVTVVNISLDSILLLVFLFSRLIPLLSGLQSNFQELLNDLPAYHNISNLLAQSETEAEAESNDSTPALKLEHALLLENISFRYRPELPLVLEHLSLHIPAFKTTAVVGPSGAGKSTLVDMVVGLFSPQAGSLSVDGVPLDANTRKAWRKNIGYVAQQTFLFNESVRENLRLTKPDASEAELFAALELAAAADFVRALPDGLDTVVGERGERLSGGERQRLALARALLRQPTLLILDEATSSLDVENEQHIQRALTKLQGQLTILVIAHRLSTISNADMIYVLDHGQFTEQGSWHHLVHQTDGRFRAWCEAQGLVATPFTG